MTVTEYIRTHDIETFTDFKTKYVDFNDAGLTSLEGIERFTNVETLVCPNNHLINLNGIEHLKSLKELRCGHNKLENLKGIENCVKLKNLYCWGNLQNLEDVKTLKLLEEIVCSSNKIKSLEPLKNFLNLGFIDCGDNQIEDYSPLLDISYLEGFDHLGNPASHKYEGLGLEEIKAKLLVELHLKSNDDLRGAASIMDTGLFDFKIK